MVTENLKNLCALVLESTSTNNGLVRVTGVNGVVRYARPTFAFPASRAETFTLVATTEGVSFGTDGTPVTERDVNLGATITGGVNVSLTTRTLERDNNGNPMLKYKFTITNTGSDTLTIREVGYKQKISCCSAPMLSDASDMVCLLDRTIVEPELVIEPTDAGIVEYTLKTLSVPTRTKAGVELASFDGATDAQFTAMVQAARLGTIDLQADCGWRVGDVRTIDMGQWTGENNVNHPAAKIDIVLSDFAEYKGCGNLFQFDFLECNGQQRMNPTNTTAGGWGGSVMYTTNMPAMFNALPQYLKDLMKEFTIGTTTNKLALRSEKEILNDGSHSDADDVQVALYKLGYRVKVNGRGGSSVLWWERSVHSGAGFCVVNGNGGATYSYASGTCGVAPFGCI